MKKVLVGLVHLSAFATVLLKINPHITITVDNLTGPEGGRKPGRWVDSKISDSLEGANR